MKPPHPLLIVPAFLLGMVLLPWLLFVLTSLIGPAFVLGGLLMIGWCLGRRVKPAERKRRISKPDPELQRHMQQMVMQERLQEIVHGNAGGNE